MYNDRLRQKKLFNARDMGGMPTADGKKIKPNKLIRSGKISKLPEDTVAFLQEIGVKHVVDLRIFTETEDHPDTQIPNAEHHHLPLLCTATAGITREKSMRITMAKEARRIKSEFGSVDNYMIAMYKQILFGEEPQKALKEFFQIFVQNDGCLLWHCSGGKDRTGMVAMLVAGILGVDEQTIINDYCISQKFQRKNFFIKRFGLHVAPLAPTFKGILFGMMNSKRLYIESAINAVKEKFGSFENYAIEHLGLTKAEIQRAREYYLE